MIFYCYIINASKIKLIIKNNFLFLIENLNQFKQKIVLKLKYNNCFYVKTKLLLKI